jgi:RNA polymerase sigma factor (sigma-70 family)
MEVTLRGAVASYRLGMKNSDATLVGAVLAGEADAYDSLVKRYYHSVYVKAWSVVRDCAAADDLTQEIFIAAFTRLSQLRDPDAFPTWLRRITSNAARMWLRSRPNGEVVCNMDTFVDSTTKENSSLNEEITAALTALPETKREAAALCYMNGFSRKDAARFLGVNESTLRKRLHDDTRLLQRRIVGERNMKEHLLPRGFESRCICACRRAVGAKRKEVISVSTSKKDCGCGCLPPPSKKKVTRRKGRKSTSNDSSASKKAR